MKSKESKELSLSQAAQKAVAELISQRPPENAIERYLNGSIEYQDMSKDEKLMYERYLSLSHLINSQRGRFDRIEIRKQHMREYTNISSSTADRDIAFVNKRIAAMMQEDNPLHQYRLNNILWDALRNAEKEKDYKAIASLSKTIKDVLGINEKTDTNLIDKLEQHVNIIVNDPLTNIILKKIVENGISTMEYNMPLDEILEREAELTQDIEHEEVRD